MKIIHFSDIHTGSSPKSVGAFFDKRVIGAINYKLRRKKHVNWHFLDKALEVIKQEKPDYVINTGDLTSTGEPSEFQEALSRLAPVTESQETDFLNVPGNHDFYTKNQTAAASRLKTYNLLNRGKYPLEKFPHKIEKPESIFILVDESCPNQLTSSAGFLKTTDFEKIDQWCSEANGKPVVLIGHYPLKNSLGKPLAKRRALKNAQGLVDLLEKGKITVSLCGHIHAAFKRQEASGSLEVCAGSLTIGGKLNKLEFDQKTSHFHQNWIDLR